jgi:hypothetical protein
MLNDDVLVSLSLIPAAFNASITWFMIFEFAANAAFAVLLVVSSPKDTVTLSGFTIVVAVPVSDRVLLALVVIL